MGYEVVRALPIEARLSRHNEDRDREDWAAWQEYCALIERLQRLPQFARIFDVEPDGSRSIHLQDPIPAWAVQRDQEGVPWLTCHGMAVLNLDAAFKRAVEADHETERRPIPMSLIDRAKADAKEREKEQRAAARQRREEAHAEIEALKEQAAATASQKLDTEITPADLSLVDDSHPENDLIYGFEQDGLHFEVTRHEGKRHFSLYLLVNGPDDPDEPEIGPRRYIRRLADLVDDDG